METLPVLAARRNTIFEVIQFIETLVITVLPVHFPVQSPWKTCGPEHAKPMWNHQFFLLDVFAVFGSPNPPPAPCTTGRLWTFCMLKKITVLPPARNINVATLTPPLVKRE